MTQILLDLKEVVKDYDKKRAVDKVSFQLPKGAIFGLLGPNGAGKTSLIRIITSITRADDGIVLFNGEPLLEKHSERMGYMPEERGLYKKMKIGEHLLYLAQLKGLSYQQAKKELTYWMEKFDIMDWWPKKIEELSKGMQQKIQFIVTILHKPDLIILDEPFSGLDPINANLIKDEMLNLNKNGATLIFSTHRMEQVEEICEEIVLINNGANVLQGKVRDIKNSYKDNIFNVDFSAPTQVILPEAFEMKQIDEFKIQVKLRENQSRNDLLQILLNQNLEISAFNEILPSLNEIFIRRVGQSNSF
ncbi:MAG: ATP-binding cassette domain-containing protein [Bacteroidetes bacterium]|nr:ATP-binding cassette domain-containing protein [Bacteroidota bacterium]